MKDKIIVTLSGGLDSATVLALAALQNKDIYAITVNYGQKNWNKEYENVIKLCETYRVKQLQVFDCRWLGNMGNSAVTDKDIQVTSATDNNIYVPFRNSIILSIAVACAEVIDCNLIYTGSIDGNSEDVCPDNTPMYYKAFNELVFEATGKKINVVAPLIKFNKRDVLKLAVDLKIPLEYTWSCISSDEIPCDKCFSCVDRKQAFESLNLVDPIYSKGNEKKYGTIR